jgi:DNA (cytosine-5)-methyltransferase 1
MKYLSLFSGVGGFELGIKQAYENILTQKTEKRTGEENEEIIRKQEGKINNEGNQRLGSGGAELLQHSDGSPTGQPTCIGYSEIDKYATQIYQSHFPSHKNYGDITKINADELPDFDFLCGGFPCQSFSIAGKRRGFADTRGTLFFDIARILQAKKPRLLLLENVKGLLSHDNGKTFATIVATLSELGYDLQWQVLNSKNFGVPQNRERVFIIGHLRGTPRPEVFPLGTTNPKALEYVGGILSEKAKLWLDNGKMFSRNFPQGSRVYKSTGISSTIASQAGGLGAKTGLYAIPVLTPDRPNKRQNGRRFKEDGEPSFTLTSQDKHGIYDGMKIRRLTPTECERLQGFPDNWTENGVYDIISLETLLTKQLCQNVKYRGAVVQSLLEKSNFVLNTTSDGRSGEIQISFTPKKEKTQENVSCVIDLRIVGECVCDITNLGNDTAMLYSLNETSNIDEITKQSLIIEKMEEKFTEQLLKIILDGNLNQQKLYTTLTAIKEIIRLGIFTCAKTEKNITNAIIVLKKSPLNYTNGALSDLKMESITSISDTQRYKMCGNAVSVPVIKAIVEKLLT